MHLQVIALWSTIEQRAGTMMSVGHKPDMVVLLPCACITPLLSDTAKWPQSAVTGVGLQSTDWHAREPNSLAGVVTVVADITAHSDWHLS